MPSLREAFLENRQRYIAVFGDDLGFLPDTERGRKTGFGEILRPFSEDARKAADALIRPAAPASAFSLIPLAVAFRATKEESYARTAKDFYTRWIDAHPTCENWTCPKAEWDAVVHGLYPWLATLHIFLESPLFDDTTADAILLSACAQLEYLGRRGYPDRNLRITFGASYLCNALRLAFLPQARRCIPEAVHIMSDACQRQLGPDGAHMEGSPHYHSCTLGDILNAYRKGRLLPELGMNVPPEHVARSMDYRVATTRPTGQIASMNDGDYYPAAGLRGKGIADVLAERAGYRQWLGLPEAPLPLAQIFPSIGQAFLRDNWTPDATYITFNATTCRSYHWHPSQNSIQLQAFGRLLVADPGRFSYTDKTWGAVAFPTYNHSTLNLNRWRQAESRPALQHRAAPGYDVLDSLYDGGYWPGERNSTGHGNGIYAEHHRLLLWAHDRFVVVIDNLFCASQPGKKPLLECVWQLSEGDVRLDPAGRRAVTLHPDVNLLMLFPLQPAGAEMKKYRGEKDPARGWVPIRFEKEYIPAPQVVLAATDYDPWNADFATVLIPHRGTTPPAVTIADVQSPETTGDFQHPGHGRIAFRWADGSTDEIWWRRRLELALNGQNEFITDGSLVHLHKDAAGKLLGGLVVDGTYIAPYAPAPHDRPATFAF